MEWEPIPLSFLILPYSDHIPPDSELIEIVPRNMRECGRKLMRSRRNITPLRDYSAVVPGKSVIFSPFTGDLRRVRLGEVASYGRSTGKGSTARARRLATGYRRTAAASIV